MRKKKDRNVYPPGLDTAKVKEIIAYYDGQTDGAAAREIATALEKRRSRKNRHPERSEGSLPSRG